MLIVKNKRYVKKHVVGGAGFFDTISKFFKRLVSSNASRKVASNLSRAAASDIGKSAITAAKTVGKELATSAINAAKDVAIEKGKQLINNKADISQKSKDILATLLNSDVNEAATNINKLMMDQGTIIIQDLVKMRNVSGLRLA
jgi:membrane-associated HD superfamily phosphohydrolase